MTGDQTEVQAALLLMARHAAKLDLTGFLAAINRAEASVKPTIRDDERRELVDSLSRVKRLVQAFVLVQEAFSDLSAEARNRGAARHVPEPPRAVFTGPDWDCQ